MQEVERNPGEERRRPDPAGVLKDRLARVLSGEFERRDGKGGHARGKFARSDGELLGVEDDGPAPADAGRMDVDRLAVEGVQDVEPVTLRARSSVTGAGLVPDMAPPDHGLVGIDPEDVEAHPGKAAGDRLADGGDAVAGLAPRTYREIVHPIIERPSVLIGCALRR